MHRGKSSVMHSFPRRFRVSHHIDSNSNPGITLEQSNRLLDSDVPRTVTLLKQSKKAVLRPFFIDICHSATANENRAFRVPVLYNVVVTSSGYDQLLPDSITRQDGILNALSKSMFYILNANPLAILKLNQNLRVSNHKSILY